MKRFVMGDLHGGYPAMVQVLQRAAFDPNEDELILLGDLCDGWPDTKKCIDFLLDLSHVTFVRGNHDHWFMQYMKTGDAIDIWTSQGGQATLDSYKDRKIPVSHRKFFDDSQIFLLDGEGNLFVHGGINPELSLAGHKNDQIMWDRSLIQNAWRQWMMGAPAQFGKYKRIYIGHTSTTYLGNKGSDVPLIMGNVVAMDTGGGWEGKLSVMNIDTDEVFQSDDVHTLYPPGTHGR